MKIVHINVSDWGGGASIAAFRLHEAMNQYGIDSNMLVFKKKTNNNKVYEYNLSNNKRSLIKLTDKAFLTFFKFHGFWSWNGIGGDVSNEKIIKDADIIYIHWINNNFLSLKSIEKILALGKPVYWYMHDMWPITGGCHYSLNCDKYKNHCQKCPMSHKMKGSIRTKDLSYYQFEEKLNRLVKFPNLKFITPSKWLASVVKESGIFKNKDVFVKPNLLNTKLFYPYDKKEARKELGLPLDKKLILFGADNTNSPYKGWFLLKEALNMGLAETECVIYGRAKEIDLQDVNIKINNIGQIHNQSKLVKLYSAADIFVTPSLADNYPNVLVEAMACGLVCIGYNVGGIPEIIRDGYSGKIVKEMNSESLYKALKELLEDSSLNGYSINAQNQIREENDYKKVLFLHQNN